MAGEQIETMQENSNGQTAKKYRLRLPAKMIDKSQISIWSILKQFIGKELSKIAMPAALCEPLTFLQRLTENVNYAYLLNRAADPSNDAVRRLEYISAFAVASISSNIGRLAKPFNPLLGETYECIREELGFKFIAEQVSHHPPVSAFHADSTDPKRNWRFYGTVYPKIKFWGKSIEIEPKGLCTIELPGFDEIYTFSTVTCCVHNIIVGTLWFEYYGNMEIICHKTGYKAVLNFRPYSWSNKELNKVDGYIYDNKKNKLKAMYGYWTHCFYSCDPDSYEAYMKTGKKPPMTQFDKNYNPISSPFNNHHGIATAGVTPTVTANSTAIPVTTTTNHYQPRLSTSISEANFASLAKTNHVGDGDNKQAMFSLSSDEDKSASSLSPPPIRSNNHVVDLERLEINERTKQQHHGHSKATSATPMPAMHRHAMSMPSQLSSLIKDLNELWIIFPRPPYASEYYNFTYFAITLNEFKEGMEKIIAPTDSRYRTDVRQLELGDLDGASREKNRLEEKQRESRRNRKEEYKGTWFQLNKHPVTNEDVWLFNNKYWLREYSKCPDLF